MKILILGSEGFIGSHLLQFMLAEGFDAFGADVLESPKAKYFQLNKDKTDFEMLFQEHKYDYCINASGNGNVGLTLEQPLLDFKLNCLNVLKALNALRKLNPECKFIHLSSAAVYGNPKKIPVSETDAVNPISPYGWHKLMSEQACTEFYHIYGIKSICLRIFSVYGDGLRKQLFWDIYQKQLQSKTITLFGTGKETRDFIYIKDLLQCVKLIMAKADFNSQVINVASGHETKIEEAAATYMRMLNPDCKVVFNGQVKVGDPLYWKADLNKLSLMGFVTQYTFEQGIKNYVQWLKEKI